MIARIRTIGVRPRIGTKGAEPFASNLCRHGRACPGHPDTEKRSVSDNRDHRHKAGDDVMGVSPGRSLRMSLSMNGANPAMWSL